MHEKKGKRLGCREKQSEYANYTTEKRCYDEYRQHEKKAGGRYSITCVKKMKGIAEDSDSILVSEDGGLPQTSLDDSGTTELSGLKKTRERRLEQVI